MQLLGFSQANKSARQQITIDHREIVMATELRRTSPEIEIRQMIEGWAAAIRAKDARGRMDGYASDAVVFDVVDPLQYVGTDAIGRRAEQWFASFAGPLKFEHRDLAITAGDDVAFCRGLNHVCGTTTKGAEIDMWWRSTMCIQRIDGRWQVVHEHQSVPFDPASGKASVALKP
jgi:uncharacterized protein (TIGR02246 family)